MDSSALASQYGGRNSALPMGEPSFEYIVDLYRHGYWDLINLTIERFLEKYPGDTFDDKLGSSDKNKFKILNLIVKFFSHGIFEKGAFDENVDFIKYLFRDFHKDMWNCLKHHLFYDLTEFSGHKFIELLARENTFRELTYDDIKRICYSFDERDEESDERNENIDFKMSIILGGSEPQNTQLYDSDNTPSYIIFGLGSNRSFMTLAEKGITMRPDEEKEILTRTPEMEPILREARTLAERTLSSSSM